MRKYHATATTHHFSQPPSPYPIAPRDEITLYREIPHFDRRSFANMGFFWDWCSLHQKDANGKRTPAEWECFKRALKNMALWYAHRGTMVYYLTRQVTPGILYSERGWTSFERSCAELAKDKRMFTKLPEWDMCVDIASDAPSAAPSRRPPMSPEIFAEQLAQKKFTTTADKSVVVELYSRTALSVLRGTRVEVRGFSHWRWVCCGGALGHFNIGVRFGADAFGYVIACIIHPPTQSSRTFCCIALVIVRCMLCAVSVRVPQKCDLLQSV